MQNENQIKPKKQIREKCIVLISTQVCYYDLQQILLAKLSHELMHQQPQFDKII
jgi:hypothetical protein